MKVAIVTGGSGGIGRCTARSLAGAQCRVFEFSRHEVAAEGVEQPTPMPSWSSTYSAWTTPSGPCCRKCARRAGDA